MNNKKLESWCSKLLDIGKRNNLINFKDTKSMTIDLVYPDIESIFEKIESSYEFEVYDPKMKEDDEDLSDEASVSESEKDVDETEGTTESAENSYFIARKKYIDTYSGKLKKKSQVLAFNMWSNPIAVIKKIAKKADSCLEETGVNVAYMAFGFICWKEKEDTIDIYKAPILLAPISFRNDSAISPYYIKMSEDDIILNPTFVQKLKAEYKGVTLPEYEEGKLADYLSRIIEIVSKLGWTVTMECKVSIFSFLKINMYEDIKNNEESILQNLNILALLGEKVYDNVQMGDKPEEGNRVENPLVDIHNVSDADSSQLKAIQMVKEGRSFVLQGPPGTGKSQTITNIIAECLYDGKKVLFVSEKQAALNVVFDRLKKAGLSDFCLELHSHKANKKEFINELYRTLCLEKLGVSEKAGSEIEQKIDSQNKLDEYERELHEKRDVIGKSLFELYENFSHYRKYPDVGYVIDGIERLDEPYHRSVDALLISYAKYAPSIGKDYRRNPWYGFGGNDASAPIKNALRNDLAIVIKGINALKPDIEYFKKLDVSIDTIAIAEEWKRAIAVISKSDMITPYFFSKKNIAALYSATTEMADLSESIIANKSRLLEEYDNEILDMNGDENYKKLTRIFNSFFKRFGAEYKSLIRSFQQYNKKGKKLGYKKAVELMQVLKDYQEQLASFKSLNETYSKYYGVGYKGYESDWDTTRSDVEYLKNLHDNAFEFGKMPLITIDKYDDYRRSKFVEESNKFDSTFASIGDGFDRIQSRFDHSCFAVRDTNIEHLENRLKGCESDIDNLDNWISFSAVMSDLNKYGAIAFVNKALSEGLEADDLAGSYAKLFYGAWIDQIIYKSGTALSKYDRVMHDEAARIFKEKDKVCFNINKVQIKSAVSAKRPGMEMVTDGSAISILKREATKKTRQKSIRVMLEQIGDLAQTIKPCFLMSPLSVSTYLSASSIRFDVVVFDEASQVLPEDAVGAIYRGTQLIVAGDSKQMPPTDFFSTKIEADEDDEEVGDVNDFDSLLDLCRGSMPQIELQWHYRSHYEQLINFSNKFFYNSDLITFPSSEDEKGKNWVGIRYINVNGPYERKKRINRREAEKIVDLIYENFEKHPERSLGVVTFNIAQQDLVDRLLSKKRQMDPRFEELFSQEREEPFFIKNLETVQGDERDTIILNTIYGRDAQGVLKQNYGPLNREGGERRLNVAITRAKDSLQVVTSLHGTDVVVGEDASRGKKLLREFLQYAENGEIALDAAIESVGGYEDFDSDFEEEVCEFLREHGYEVDPQVGCCRYKIDMGLRRHNSSDYVLAIECDGATYHSSKNARDRDRLRQEVLERMGWKFYRIWSTDWFNHKPIEKERLLNAVEDALAGREVVAGSETVQEERSYDTQSAPEPESFEEVIVEKQQHFAKYKTADVDALSRICQNRIQLIENIIKVESPISAEWLLKRLLPFYDAERVSKTVRNEFEKELKYLNSNEFYQKNGFLYYRNKGRISFRVPETSEDRRDMKYIAPEEIATGMLVFIQRNVTVERKGLYSAIVQEQGYKKLTENSTQYLDFAVRVLAMSNLIDVDGDMITLKK